MREIKFRAINSEGKLVYNVETPNAFLIHNLPVMKFTGLHDKNGREIYEGDILSSETEGNAGVEWESEFACFGTFWYEDFEDQDTGKIIRIKRRGGLLANELKDCPNLILIGNIHENPDLLK